MAHRDQLWRIVRTYPDRHVQLDTGMGRSAYLCPQESCLRAAQRKNRLGRILNVQIPSDIYKVLQSRLAPLEARLEHGRQNAPKASNTRC